MRGTPEQRMWAKIEMASFNDCWLWTGATNDHGYGQITIDGRRHYVHRLMYEQMRTSIPRGMLLDHRYTCPKNCANPWHLRVVDKSQNGQNHSGARRDSKSGVRGVYQHGCGKWYGQVTLRGQCHGTGLKSTRHEAAIAVIELRNSLFTHNDVDRVPSLLN